MSADPKTRLFFRGSLPDLSPAQRAHLLERTPMDEPTVVDLLDRGAGLFELPLLSHRREMHDRLSGCTGALDATLAAMAHIRAHWGQFVAVFVATKLNLADLY